MNREQELFNHALALFSKNEYEKAYNIFKKIPEGAMDALKYYHMGMCLVKMGNLEKGLYMYKKVREIPIDDENVQRDKMMYGMYINMASVMQVLGRRKMKKAKLHSLRKSDEIQWKSKGAESPRGTTKDISWEKLIEDAVTCYEYATQIDESDPRVWNNLGNAYLDLNEFGNAHKSFDKAIQLDDEFPEAHYSKSLAYEYNQFYDKSIEQLKLALKFRNRTKIYLIKIIALLFGTKKFDEALKYAIKMAEYHPKDPDSFKFLTLILYNMRRFEEAYQSYQDLLLLEPDFEDPELENIIEDLLERMEE